MTQSMTHLPDHGINDPDVQRDQTLLAISEVLP